jgi:tetratricopeptide (TPR) repeat protein
MRSTFDGTKSLDGLAESHALEIPPPVDVPANLHAPFLERAEPGRNAASEQALGAFLTMRVIDQFADSPREAAALSHQIRATTDFLRNLHPQTNEICHLEQIVSAAETAHQSGETWLLWSPLTTFAAWLERQLRLAEALDVLDTALRVAKSLRDSGAAMSMELQRGRVLRCAGRAREATQAYAAAGELATEHGDTHTELLSRIGRGIVLRQVGNLPAAERLLTEVYDDALALRDRDAQARSQHDLAVNHVLQERPDEAVVAAYRAYQTYDESENKQRALADLGTALERLGHYTAAKDAFELVLAGSIPMGMRVRIVLELLGLAATTQDRVSFELRRREIEAVDAELPPSTMVDYEIKMGCGLVAFGRQQKAKKYLESAIRRAEEHHLNESLFRAETALRDIDARATEKPSAPQHVDWEQSYPDVSEVADALHALLITA